VFTQQSPVAVPGFNLPKQTPAVIDPQPQFLTQHTLLPVSTMMMPQNSLVQSLQNHAFLKLQPSPQAQQP